MPTNMTRKLSKEEIKDKFDGEELDLSLCNLAKVPVREMVSVFLASDQRLDGAQIFRVSASDKSCLIINCKTPS